jgi:hypothetical protein
MSRALISVALAIPLAVAMPLLAGEKAKSAEKQQAKPAQTAATTTAAPAATSTAVPDSPLVAAARRANRLGKKPTNVITNETLTKSSGTAHVTTAASPLKPIVLPPPASQPNPTPEMIAAAKTAEERKKAEAIAAQKQKAEEERRKRVHDGARMAEGSIEERYEADAESYQGPEVTEVHAPPPPQF